MSKLSTSRFWDKYIDKTNSYGVRPTVQRWYVRHAEAYIKAHGQLRLAEHSPREIEKYLGDKGRSPHIND